MARTLPTVGYIPYKLHYVHTKLNALGAQRFEVKVEAKVRVKAKLHPVKNSEGMPLPHRVFDRWNLGFGFNFDF